MKDCNEKFRALWSQESIDSEDLGRQGTEFVGKLEELCKAEGIQVYFSLKETKAAFVKRTIRSLKKMFYRCMEDCAYKLIH